MIDPSLLELLRCPVTRETLHLDRDDRLENASGTEHYPIVHGIPDFRRFDPPYMTREEENTVADRLAERLADLSYDELLEYFEREVYPHQRPDAQIEKSIGHRRALVKRSPGRLEWMLDSTGGRARPRGLTLDLGCGSGEATAALAVHGAETVIGLDISLAELMLAKKLLAERGTKAHLVAGYAEALPFADGILDFIYSPDVIEHVSDQNLYMQEARRTLKPDGDFLLNSPNRYSIVCPEPHNGVWFFGFLPRGLMDPASRLVGRGPYTGKRLVSLFELRRLLANTFPHFQVYYRRANPQATSLPGRLFHATRAVSEPAFSLVCDQHVIHAGHRVD